jgi:hypothetical protein
MLIPIETLKITNGKCLSLDSQFVKAGIQQLKNKKMVKIEDHESTIEFPELLLEILEIAQAEDGRNCNDNATIN